MLPRAKKGVLVGYKDTKGKIYLVYIPKERRVVTVRDVRFHEGLPQPETQDDIDIATATFIDPDIIVNEDTQVITTMRLRSNALPIQNTINLTELTDKTVDNIE